MFLTMFGLLVGKKFTFIPDALWYSIDDLTVKTGNAKDSYSVMTTVGRWRSNWLVH